MAQPPADLSALLAVLAGQHAANTPSQTPSNQAPPPGMSMSGFPTLPPRVQPQALPSYPLPQPASSGSLDLSAIKPVNTGSVSLNDALAKARSFAAERGLSYDQGRDSGDSRRGGASYGRSRSRSRSPPRRDSYNPYRDERRDDSRRGQYPRDRSRSPPRGARYSPQNGRGYGRERSPPRRDNDDSEVISIDSNLVGLVIGRQGENLRRIEQETGARIQFITPPDHPGPQRQCRLSGNVANRNDAKKEIFRTIDENNASHSQDQTQNRGSSNNRQQTKTPSQPVLREGENAMQIMVPDRTVGLIIGRGGETIRDLQDRSGCHINIVGVNKSLNGLRPVNLIGSQQASSKAKELILEIVESDTRNPQGQNDNAQPASYNQPRSNDNQQQAPGKLSETIQVPSEAVGMIIGKGGETIREMQQSTQCKINVSQASGVDVERDIGLVGTPQAIDAAKRAIWDKVDMVREKSNQRANPNRNDNSDRHSHQNHGQQNSYGQQSYSQDYSQAAPAADGTSSAADPYAAYGGYANYMALWYAALQSGAKPGQDGQPAPGA